MAQPFVAAVTAATFCVLLAASPAEPEGIQLLQNNLFARSREQHMQAGLPLRCSCQAPGKLCGEAAGDRPCCGGATCQQQEKGGPLPCTRAPWQDQWEALKAEWSLLCKTPAVEAAWNAAVEGLSERVLVSGNPVSVKANPWLSKQCLDFGMFFGRWLEFLPDSTNGLEYIEEINFLVRNNPAGLLFLNRLQITDNCPVILDWTTRWQQTRKDFMDSPDSAVLIPHWINNLYTETVDGLSNFEVPDPSCNESRCGFTS